MPPPPASKAPRTVTQDARLYTTVEVAKRLGVSAQTVQRWVDAGRLKAWKTLGGHRRIEAASAELLFAEKEAHGGAVQSSQSTQSTPADEVAAAVAAGVAALAVVVVDDNPLDCALVVALVRQAMPDATVESAANGFQGLVAIGRLAPQIVITDIHMPHMNGFEMIRTLLQDEGVGPRTLIAVTALSRQELAAMGTLPAEVQVFTKPLDQRRFLAALKGDR